MVLSLSFFQIFSQNDASLNRKQEMGVRITYWINHRSYSVRWPFIYTSICLTHSSSQKRNSTNNKCSNIEFASKLHWQNHVLLACFRKMRSFHPDLSFNSQPRSLACENRIRWGFIKPLELFHFESPVGPCTFLSQNSFARIFRWYVFTFRVFF